MCSSSSPNPKTRLTKPKVSSCSSTVTSSQDVNCPQSPESPPPSKRHCKSDRSDLELSKNRTNSVKEEVAGLNTLTVQTDTQFSLGSSSLQPKIEIPDYISDDEGREEGSTNFNSITDITELTGNSDNMSLIVK